MSPIVTVPSQVLRTPTKPVTSLDTRVQKVIEDMYKTLRKTKNPQGVGLAAPQIGVSLKIFLARPDPNGEISLFINPEIVKFSQKQIDPHKKKGVYEGCLSIPGHYAPVRRAMSVTVKYQTINNSPLLFPSLNLREGAGGELLEKTEVFTGFPAHVIQHEMDHLNGILFIDRVLEQNVKLYKVKDKDDWEEVSL
jgi:peptide deformylase